MKKLALYFVSFCWLFFVGCSDNSPTPTQLTVMFNVDGGSAVAQQTVEENEKATKPTDPTKDLYTFEGWYSDEALTTSFDFETPITANTTLYAKWTEKTFTVTYKSDASTEVGTEKVSQVTPTLARNSTNSFLVEGKYTSKFFTDEAKNTAFTFPKELTAGVTIYVTLKDIVTPADSTALRTEVDNAIKADGNSPDLNYINTEKVTNMKDLFRDKFDFNGDVSLWNVSAVTTMEGMFQQASKFNGDISKWNVRAVTDMSFMFGGASVFNGDISDWEVSAVEGMSSMFSSASEFNSDISKWNVRAVTDMESMFNGASVFNGDISKWNVSAVEGMSSMFSGASVFNADISDWNVGAVTTMDGMFNSATAFNSDISKWDVSAVTSMGTMFQKAIVFNADISGWELNSNMESLALMFNGATAFNRNLEEWREHLPLDDNGKFSGFLADDIFDGSGVENNPPSWDPNS